MEIDLARLTEAVDFARHRLGESLLSFSIVEASTGLALATFEPRPVMDAILTELDGRIDTSLLQSRLRPGLGDYCLFELDGRRLAIIIRPAAQLRGLMLLDLTKANLGTVLAIVVPRILTLCRGGD